MFICICYQNGHPVEAQQQQQQQQQPNPNRKKQDTQDRPS